MIYVSVTFRDMRAGRHLARRRTGMNDNSLKFLHIGAGAERRAIAVREQAGAPPGLFWLGGFKSDMQGTKAVALAHWAEQAGRACVRFDYSGHGESGGDFTDGTHRPLAGRGARGVRRLLPRSAGRDRIVDGRLAGAAVVRALRASPGRRRRRSPVWC